MRSDSFLDVPGPGTYGALNEGMRHKIPGKTQMDMPAYTMRPLCAPIANNPRKPPGPGPFEYENEHKHQVSNNRQPAWIVPKHKRVSEALLPVTGTDPEVGPGKYEHPTALVTKYGL